MGDLGISIWASYLGKVFDRGCERRPFGDLVVEVEEQVPVVLVERILLGRPL